MWIRLIINGVDRGTRKVSGPTFVERLRKWIKDNKLDVEIRLL